MPDFATTFRFADVAGDAAPLDLTLESYVGHGDDGLVLTGAFGRVVIENNGGQLRVLGWGAGETARGDDPRHTFALAPAGGDTDV